MRILYIFLDNIYLYFQWVGRETDILSSNIFILVESIDISQLWCIIFENRQIYDTRVFPIYYVIITIMISHQFSPFLFFSDLKGELKKAQEEKLQLIIRIKAKLDILR